ncbi:MAG: ribonuclease E/G [Clostridia bacterium]
MNQEVFINDKKEFCEVAILVDGKLQHYYNLSNDMLTGSVVLGKVIKINKLMGIFVDIGNEKNALLKFRNDIKIGDMLVVQIKRDEVDNKGCSISENITIAGRYLVLNDEGVYKFSRKINSQNKEELLKIKSGYDNLGFVFRSACDDANIIDIEKESKILVSNYLDVINNAKNNTKIQILYKEEALDIAKRFAINESNIRYDFEEIKDELDRLQQRKVYVEGIEIVVDKTEAMTVIDVNSHQFNKQYKDIDNAHFQANLLAVSEIARILRVRNIGGIIMVDFISLAQLELKKKLLVALNNELKKDNVMVKAELIESLSLFAIVRKQRYASL